MNAQPFPYYEREEGKPIILIWVCMCASGLGHIRHSEVGLQTGATRAHH